MYGLWSLCIEMSKEDHYNMLKDAWKLLMQDIRRVRVGIIAAALYLGFMELVLHNGCPFVVLTGFPCPACGLTRAGIHVLKGEWMEALRLNFAIYPIIVLVIAAVIRRYFMKQSLRCLLKYVMILIIAMVVYYVYRMLVLFPGAPPMTYYYDNFLLRIVRLLKG